jgi:hypothetical protein
LKPISPLIIVAWVLVSGIVGFGYSTYAVNNGLEVPISGITLALSTALIAVVLLGLAVPIWKYKRTITKALTTSKPLPVNPFYAVRVLLLSKAAAITGAMLIGWHAGVLVKQFTAPVVVTDATTPNITALVAAVLLLIVGFVVEQICKLPSDKSKDE